MNAPTPAPRIPQRALGVGPLRAFEAVARLLSFRGAGEELHLTQPAISRQIRGLEEELGTPLFLRGTRHVALTPAGEALQRTVQPLLDKLDSTVRHLRAAQRRQPVGVTTFASFASMWLLPRLQAFQAQHPQADIRISANDHFEDFDAPEIDLALRHCRPEDAPPGAVRLFGEVLTPVASPALLAKLPLRQPADLARHTLLEEDDHKPSAEYVSWHFWLRQFAPQGLEPRSWIHLNFTYQRIQAALAGQGVALARLSLAHDAVANGDLVEPFGAAGRVASPFAYWLVRWPGRRDRPALLDFEAWVLAQARATEAALAEHPVDPAGTRVPTAAEWPSARQRRQ